MTSDYMGLPRSLFDPERVHGVIALAIENHPELDRVGRFLRAGAAFFARHDDGNVKFALAFSDNAAELAAVRADVWGHDAEEIADADRNEVIDIACVPASILGQPPQG